MHKLIFVILSFILAYSTTLYAQQTSTEYDRAVSAYQSGNFIEAEQLWIKLADQGDANAQYALGIMNLKKEAQRSDDATAFRYLVEAAKKQHVASMFNLGVAYWEGRGVARQPEKALNWWEVAAQRDDAGAQFNLGLAYYIGEGRPQSTPKAIYWTQQAAKNGHPQAKALLETLQLKAQSERATAKSAPAVGRQAQKKLSSAPSSPPARSLPPGTRISKNLTTLQAAPAANSVKLLSIQPGTSIQVLKTSGDWARVRVQGNYPVWVYETFLNDNGDGTGDIKGNNVNIRPSASTDNRTSPALGQLNQGARVTIVQKRKPWIQIIPAKPFPGWLRLRDI